MHKVNKKDPHSELCKDKELHIVFSVTLMAVLGVSSITPSFPKIIDFFNISPQSVGLLITVFTIPGIVLTPVAGILADRFGRKRILVPSLFLFGIAGFACAFAHSFSWLLILRFIQGIGAASLGSLNVTIIGDLYQDQKRGTAMGYNASVLSIGTASYPSIGGLLALLGWNFPFFLPIVAIPIGLVVLFKLNNPEPHTKQNLNEYFIGVWKSINREVTGLFLASTVTFIILYGAYLTYYPILIGKSFGRTTLVIGLVMSSMSGTTAIVSSQLGKLIRRFSERKLIRISFLLYGIAMFMVPMATNIWILLIPTMLYGVAQGLNMPAIQTLLAGLAPMEHRGAFMSANGMVLRLGQTIGPLFAGFFFVQWQLSGVFISGSILALVMAVVTLGMLREE